jgi:hypothetical protein
VKRPKRIRIVIASALAVALALAVFHLRYSHAAAWRLPAGERPYVDRAVAAAAREFRTSPEDIRRTTRPFVRQLPDRVCVRLRTGGTWPDGSYEACHARRDGRLLSTRSMGPTFGNQSLLHRLKDLFWSLFW